MVTGGASCFDSYVPPVKLIIKQRVLNMSVDITYDKLSIKLSANNYMTMTLVGCSSLTDDEGKICRSWNALWPPGLMGGAVQARPWGSLSELKVAADNKRIAVIEEVSKRDGVYSDKEFGSHIGHRLSNGKMSFGQFKGLWVNATKKSITVSKLYRLFRERIELSVNSYFVEGADFEDKRLYPKTGRQLMRMYRELVEYTGGKAPVYIQMSADDDLAKRVRSRLYHPHRLMRRVEVDHYYTIKIGDYYLRCLNRKGGAYHTWGSPALRYVDKAKALKMLKYYKKKRPHHEFTWERIDKRAIIHMPVGK